jgi:stearoyl-CoA desaturase (delta-9 desaturase)
MFSLSWPMFALLALCTTQIVIMLVTVYFHRAVSHRALILHPAVHKVSRFLSWFMIAMNPQEFAAVHRKHHAKVDTPDDPHSPLHHGVLGVLFGGLPLYRAASRDPAVIEAYGHGMHPDNWEGFYRRHPNLGVLLFAALAVGLLGWQGVLLWGMHMLWIPFWAAGVINGLGHHVGYRQFATKDASTNLVPWGLWVGGEELHNNHHGDPSSAKFSRAWYEVDLGWGLIQALCFLRLAEVRAHGQWQERADPVVDTKTVQHLLQQRAHWLAEWRRAVTRDLRPTLKAHRFRHWQQFVSRLETALPRAQALAADTKASAVLRCEQAWIRWSEARHPTSEAALNHLHDLWQSFHDLDLPHVRAWCQKVAKMEYTKPVLQAT